MALKYDQRVVWLGCSVRVLSRLVSVNGDRIRQRQRGRGDRL